MCAGQFWVPAVLCLRQESQPRRSTAQDCTSLTDSRPWDRPRGCSQECGVGIPLRDGGGSGEHPRPLCANAWSGTGWPHEAEGGRGILPGPVRGPPLPSAPATTVPVPPTRGCSGRRVLARGRRSGRGWEVTAQLGRGRRDLPGGGTLCPRRPSAGQRLSPPGIPPGLAPPGRRTPVAAAAGDPTRRRASPPGVARLGPPRREDQAPSPERGSGPAPSREDAAKALDGALAGGPAPSPGRRARRCDGPSAPPPAARPDSAEAPLRARPRPRVLLRQRLLRRARAEQCPPRARNPSHSAERRGGGGQEVASPRRATGLGVPRPAAVAPLRGGTGRPPRLEGSSGLSSWQAAGPRRGGVELPAPERFRGRLSWALPRVGKGRAKGGGTGHGDAPGLSSPGRRLDPSRPPYSGEERRPPPPRSCPLAFLSYGQRQIVGAVMQRVRPRLFNPPPPTAFPRIPPFWKGDRGGVSRRGPPPFPPPAPPWDPTSFQRAPRQCCFWAGGEVLARSSASWRAVQRAGPSGRAGGSGVLPGPSSPLQCAQSGGGSSCAGCPERRGRGEAAQIADGTGGQPARKATLRTCLDPPGISKH